MSLGDRAARTRPDALKLWIRLVLWPVASAIAVAIIAHVVHAMVTCEGADDQRDDRREARKLRFAKAGLRVDEDLPARLKAFA